MFPFGQSGELFFKVASNKSNSHRISRDLVFVDHYGDDADDPLVETKVGVLDNKTERIRGRKVCSGSKRNGINVGSVDEESTRKKKHREIEKQRRQDMAGLYAGLRSLLPLEYVKGKRSISDHMNEAVNYIKHLHTKISELSSQRDKLKKLCNSTSVNSRSGGDSAVCSRHCVVEISRLCDGNEVEIIISRGSKYEGEDFRLSTLLEVLLEQGFNVVNCFSTKVNDKTLDKIHCEAGEEAKLMDPSELRHKLEKAIN